LKDGCLIETIFKLIMNPVSSTDGDGLKGKIQGANKIYLYGCESLNFVRVFHGLYKPNMACQRQASTLDTEQK
jgi:hypothetical protein